MMFLVGNIIFKERASANAESLLKALIFSKCISKHLLLTEFRASELFEIKNSNQVILVIKSNQGKF